MWWVQKTGISCEAETEPVGVRIACDSYSFICFLHLFKPTSSSCPKLFTMSWNILDYLHQHNLKITFAHHPLMGTPAFSSHGLCSAHTALTLMMHWWTGRAQRVNQDAAARLVEQRGSFLNLVASPHLKYLRWKMAFSWWLRSSPCLSLAHLWGWQGPVEQLEAITSRTAPPWAAGRVSQNPKRWGCEFLIWPPALLEAVHVRIWTVYLKLELW